MLSLMQMNPEKDQKDILTASQNNDRGEPNPPTREKIIWYHSLAVGVLQASFEELYKWIQERHRTTQATLGNQATLRKLATLRHGEMAHGSVANGQLFYRPQKRIKFCQDVAKRAKDIAIELIGNQNWRRVFDASEGSTIRYDLANKEGNHLKDLRNAAKELTKCLGRFRPESTFDPLLVVVFDEASSLLKVPGEKPSPGRYV